MNPKEETNGKRQKESAFRGQKSEKKGGTKHFKKMCHRCERTPEKGVECKGASSCAATSASFMHCWRSRSNSKSSRSARFSAVLQISCRKWAMTCKRERLNMSRESLGKICLHSFYIAWYCSYCPHLLVCLLIYCLEHLIVFLFGRVQLETMTPLSRHNANETGELSTSTMRSMGRPKRRKSSSCEGK